MERINKTKNWFFEKTNKIYKFSFKLTKTHRENIQLSKIRNKKGDITSETKKVHRIVRSYVKNL